MWRSVLSSTHDAEYRRGTRVCYHVPKAVGSMGLNPAPKYDHLMPKGSVPLTGVLPC